MAANLAVVISSCDLYSDCWKPLFHSIHQYWSDCPYSIYLISNHKDSGDESIRTIKVGEHLGWGSNTKKALAEIHEEYTISTGRLFSWGSNEYRCSREACAFLFG